MAYKIDDADGLLLNTQFYITSGGALSIGQGETSDASAIFELVSTSQGIVFPRMTNTQQNSISNPLKSLMIYSLDDDEIHINTGTPGAPVWENFISASGGVVGSGTLNYLAKFTPDGTSLGDSLIIDDGTTTAINGSIDSNYTLIAYNNAQSYTIYGVNTYIGAGTQAGVAGSSQAAGTGLNVGVMGNANANSVLNIGVKGFTSGASAVNLGGHFIAAGATANYSLRLSDGTEAAGKFLKSVDVNGNANWADITEADITDLGSYATTSHTHTLVDVTDITATAAEVNLLDLSGLTIGWVLAADSATTASWRQLLTSELNNDAGFITGSLLNISPAAYTTLQDLQTVIHSAGHISGGIISDNGDGTYNVTGGEGTIRSSDSSTADLYFINWVASNNIAIADGLTRFIGIEYNGGAPQIVVKTTDVWDFNTEFPLGAVIREGSIIHVHSFKQIMGNHISLMNQRAYETDPLSRDKRGGGLKIGATGTRNVSVTAGNVWSRFDRKTITSKDTSASDTFDAYYDDGAGGWTRIAAQSQINNSQYDNGSGSLQTLTNNRFTVRWVYVEVDDELVVVFGKGEYTSLALAKLESTPASLPPRLEQFGLLIGRIIVEELVDPFTSISSAFDVTFNPTNVINHNDLSLLQGGTAGESFHLTEAQHIQLTGITATSSEVNLLDLDSLSVGWVLAADSASTASWRLLLGSEISNDEGWTNNTGTVTGTGATDRLAYWSDTNILTSDADLYVINNPGTDVSLNFTDGDGIFGSFGAALATITAEGFSPSYRNTSFSDTAAHAPLYITYRSKGTEAAKTAVTSGIVLQEIDAYGSYDSTNYHGSFALRAEATETWSGSQAGTKFSILTMIDGGISLTQKFAILGTGNIQLGNFVFDFDQTVGAGQDNYVLTYDNSSGLISLEAAGGSGDVATDVIWDAKGDLAGGTGSDTAARLPVGSNGQVLTADSAETTGMKWATPAAGSAWTKITIAYTDFTAAATTQTINLFTLASGAAVTGIFMEPKTAFAGTGITAYTVSVGLSGDNQKYAENYDVFTAVGATRFGNFDGHRVESVGGTTQITITAISTGGNLNAGSAGSVDVYYKTEQITF
jgi:hypothetical protein